MRAFERNHREPARTPPQANPEDLFEIESRRVDADHDQERTAHHDHHIPSRDQPSQREEEYRAQDHRGKERSRFNAVKHGCRARLPILPGEDPAAYQDRLDAWIGKFGPRDAVELYLVERAVHVSWQLDRADRAEVARLADGDRPGGRPAGQGRRRAGGGPVPRPRRRDRRYPELVGDPDDVRLSWPFDPSHPGHPARVVAALEATAVGCAWLLEQWAALGKLLDDGLNWQPPDRLRAIRLLGKQPLDAIDDEPVMAIYLACHAMDPEGPDVVRRAVERAEPLREEELRKRLAGRVRRGRSRCAAGRGGRPGGAAGGRRRGRRPGGGAAGGPRGGGGGRSRRRSSARLTVDAKESVEWLRKHQATCSRALFRTFDELRKLRREFGDDPPADEEPAEPPSPGPCADAARASCPCGDAHGQDARAKGEADVARASSPCEVVEQDALPPTGSEPGTTGPVDDRDARNVTNEATDPSASRPSASRRGSRDPALRPTGGLPGPDADGPSASPPSAAEPDDARNVTNEASDPAERAAPTGPNGRRRAARVAHRGQPHRRLRGVGASS